MQTILANKWLLILIVSVAGLYVLSNTIVQSIAYFQPSVKVITVIKKVENRNIITKEVFTRDGVHTIETIDRTTVTSSDSISSVSTPTSLATKSTILYAVLNYDPVSALPSAGLECRVSMWSLELFATASHTLQLKSFSPSLLVGARLGVF